MLLFCNGTSWKAAHFLALSIYWGVSCSLAAMKRLLISFDLVLAKFGIRTMLQFMDCCEYCSSHTWCYSASRICRSHPRWTTAWGRGTGPGKPVVAIQIFWAQCWWLASKQGLPRCFDGTASWALSAGQGSASLSLSVATLLSPNTTCIASFALQYNSTPQVRATLSSLALHQSIVHPLDQSNICFFRLHLKYWYRGKHTHQ